MVLFTWLLAIGCTDGSESVAGPSDDGNQDVRVSYVEVTPDGLTLEKGSTDEITLKVLGSDGTPLDRDGSWEIEDSAVVELTGSGTTRTIRGLEEGSTLITAKVGKFSDGARIKVQGNSQKTVEVHLSPAHLELETGAVSDIVLEVADASGDSLDRSGQWSVGDETVIRLTGDGSTRQVEALSDGSTVVIAKVGSVADTAAIEVTAEPNPEEVTDLSVATKTEASIQLEWTEVDDGTGEPAKYALRYRSPTMDSWDEANPTEETAEGDGIGTSVAHEFTALDSGTDYEFQLVAYRGTLDVDATFGSLSNVASATTDAASDTTSNTSITKLGGDGQTDTVGETLAAPLVVEVTDESGAGISGVAVTWSVLSGGGSVSADSSSTDENGRAQVDWTLGGTVGTQEVQAEIGSGDAVSFAATADAGSVATVQVSPSFAEVTEGNTVQLDATLEDTYGNEVEDSVTWSSSNTTVAQVDGSGLVQANQAGDATITAAASNGTTGSAEVNVTSSEWTTITDRPWNALEEDGWHQIVNKPVIEADNTGPVSPGSVGASYFPEGQVDTNYTERAGINFYRNNETFAEVYISMHVYVTSNYIGHPSGTNKVFWVLDSESGGGGDPFFMKLQGVDSADLTLAFTIQNADGDVSNREFKPSAAEAIVPRGEWTQIEFQMKINTGTNADGELRAWVDGTKVVEATDVQYVGSASDYLFDELRWAPMWGGGGEDPSIVIPPQMGFKIDHMIVKIL